MIAREKLKELIDELPEGELVPAERFLEYLRDRARTRGEISEEPLEIQLPPVQGRTHRILSPRLVNSKDAELFRVKMTVLDRPVEEILDAEL